MTSDLLKNERGMAAILAVLIICAAALLIAKNIIKSSLTSLDLVSNFSQGQKALVVADSCLEEILRRLQIDNDFIADKLVWQSDGSTCLIKIEADNSRRTIEIVGTVGEYFKKIKAEIAIGGNGEIDLIKWEEVN